MKAHRISMRAALLGVFISALALTSQAQDLRESLFKETDLLLEQARAANASLLSPENFAKADKAYTRASSMLEKNKSIESIREELGEAQGALRESLRQAELAKVSLADLIAVRNAAVKAQAEVYAPEEWQKAEDAFDGAARALEFGDVRRSESRAGQAAPLMLKAELIAIQTAILGQARSAIAAADDAKVDKTAPETLDKARALVSQAEAQLATNRYDTSEPLQLAAEAEYEARHAAYLASQAERLKDRAVTTEQLLLEWEAPLAAIAAATDSSVDFSNGFAVPAESALARITAGKAALADSQEQVLTLSSRVEQLEEQLGITTRRAEASELRRQRVAQVEQLFSSNEAIVVQEGGQVIVRLIGLQFATGEAVIESQYFGLLRKLDQVPAIFPGASLIVEGHTDAQGNDTMNLALSERRANSVRDYLLAATALRASAIQAKGYGEARPIANNETAEGRAKNRRTDVVIVPAAN